MKKLYQWLFWLIIFLVFISSTSFGLFLYELSKTLPQNLEDELHKRNDILPTILYDRDGNQVDELFIQRRIVVPYEQFPTHLVQALIASEDSRFFSHLGIDPLRIPRAFIENLKAGRIVQGASTLTQQTARLFLLSREKQIIRKLREMLLAFRMEMRFSKQEILSLYLNKVYLGNAEGVEASSQGYFGKHVSELNLAESALLVGILPAPSRYAPHINPEFALIRRNLVNAKSESKTDDALSSMPKGLSIKNDPFIQQFDLAITLYEMKDYEKAKTLLDEIIDKAKNQKLIQQAIDLRSKI